MNLRVPIIGRFAGRSSAASQAASQARIDDSLMLFDQRRREMQAAWQAAAPAMSEEDAQAEIEATASAMRQLWQLRHG